MGISPVLRPVLGRKSRMGISPVLRLVLGRKSKWIWEIPEELYSPKVGLSAVLVVDGVTRELLEVGAVSGEEFGSERREVLPGSGPIVNVDGLQLDDGSWVVVGNDCDSAETVDPGGCASTTVAVVDDDGSRAVEDVPDGLRGRFVGLRGAGPSGVLLWGWYEGESTYWVLDPETLAIDPVPWESPRLEAGDQLLVDDELSELGPQRSACLAGERLLVVDGAPSGGGSELTTSLTAVDVETGAVELDGEILDLEPGVVLDRLLCNDDEAQLVSLNHRTDRPVVHELAIEGGRVEVGAPQEHDSLPDGYDRSGSTYGTGSVAVKYIGEEEEDVSTSEPAPGGGPGTVTMTTRYGEVGVAQYTLGHGWETTVTDRMNLGEKLFPLADPEPNLIVITAGGVGDITYRAGL